MKITMVCTKREEDEYSYIYHFGVKKLSDDFNLQKIAGDLHIRSKDPLHFKLKYEYTFILSDLIIASAIVPGRN